MIAYKVFHKYPKGRLEPWCHRPVDLRWDEGDVIKRVPDRGPYGSYYNLRDVIWTHRLLATWFEECTSICHKIYVIKKSTDTKFWDYTDKKRKLEMEPERNALLVDEFRILERMDLNEMWENDLTPEELMRRGQYFYKVGLDLEILKGE
jgi:hypothetical protein